MRKLLLAIIVIAISAGCATFTAEEGYSMMALPEEEPLKETKLSMLGDTEDITITTTDEEEEPLSQLKKAYKLGWQDILKITRFYLTVNLEY